MKLYKKIFFKLLKIVPLTALVVIIVGCIVLAIMKPKKKELTEKEFTELALSNNITDFVVNDLTYEMELDWRKKYTHHFKDVQSKDNFEEVIQDRFGIFSTGSTYNYNDDYNVYYGVLIGTTLGAALFILLFYAVVVLWFVSLFDLLKSEFLENHNKWIWLICLLLLPFISPLFYLFIAEKQKRAEAGNHQPLTNN
jgi:cytochrome bd-type quinol oxidase subunit 2